MSNKVKLENPLYGVNLTLAERVVINTTTSVTGGSGSGDLTFIHNQTSMPNIVNNLAYWTINHNLGKYCSVTVVDSNDDVIIGDIHYNSINQVTLTFTAAFTGKAYCN